MTCRIHRIAGKLIRNIDATPDLKVTANSVSMEEAISMFKKREVRGIIQIPETFSSDIAIESTNNNFSLCRYGVLPVLQGDDDRCKFRGT